MKLETFYEKFDQFADAPDSVEKIRALVLHFAVAGKLVAQNPTDVPAVRYLAKATSLDSAALPKLPSRWTWARVDETGRVDLGRQRAPQHHRGPHMRPYLRVQNVYEARIDLSDVKEMNFTPAEFETFALHSGDLLLNEGQSRELVGRPAIYRGEVPGACFQNTLVRYRHRDFVLPEYALIVFRAYMRTGRFQRISKQTTNIAHLSAGRFAKLEFPLPPLAEQKRIVAKVDELMALCDRLEAQQQERETRHAALARASLSRFDDAPTPANLNFLFHQSYIVPPADLRKSILTLAVQGKLIPQHSEPSFGTLESILAEASVNGVSKGPTLDTSATEILRISAGTSRGDFYVNEDDFKHVDLSRNEIEKFRLASGDLLACRFNGNLRYVGRFSLYRGESGRVQVNPDKLIRFRVNAEVHSPRYVCYAMNAAPTREAIEAMCATTAGNIGLSAGRLKAVKIPLPPLDEQRRIVAKVDQLMTLVDELEAQLAASRATAARLLEALVAELTVSPSKPLTSAPAPPSAERELLAAEAAAPYGT